MLYNCIKTYFKRWGCPISRTSGKDALEIGHPLRKVKIPGGNVTHIPMGDCSPISARFKHNKYL